jgi:hypothetical protein
MKHLGKVSVVRSRMTSRCAGGAFRGEPDFADAKSDFLNAIWKAFGDFVVQKKNEFRIG